MAYLTKEAEKKTATLKIKPFKKVYKDDDGNQYELQPVICSECGYDSAMDEIASHNYCPNCGAEITDISGSLL